MAHQVTVFQTYPLQVGQKINIADGPRRGDWLVIGLTEQRMQLRCPVSGREVEWERFCYLVEERSQEEWPSGGEIVTQPTRHQLTTDRKYCRLQANIYHQIA